MTAAQDRAEEEEQKRKERSDESERKEQPGEKRKSTPATASDELELESGDEAVVQRPPNKRLRRGDQVGGTESATSETQVSARTRSRSGRGTEATVEKPPKHKRELTSNEVEEANRYLEGKEVKFVPLSWEEWDTTKESEKYKEKVSYTYVLLMICIHCFLC